MRNLKFLGKDTIVFSSPIFTREAVVQHHLYLKQMQFSP